MHFEQSTVEVQQEDERLSVCPGVPVRLRTSVNAAMIALLKDTARMVVLSDFK
jgi:hypothetical protein